MKFSDFHGVVPNQSHSICLTEINEWIRVVLALPALDVEIGDHLGCCHCVPGRGIVEVNDKRAHIIKILLKHGLSATDIVDVSV